MQHNIVTGNRNQLGPFQQRNINPYSIGPNYSHQNQRMVQHPAGMGAMSNAYVTAAIYNPPVNTCNLQPTIQTPSPICNLTNYVQILSSVSTPSPIVFRKLPFYEMKYEIVKPTVLAANHQMTLLPTVRSSATQEFHLDFVLTAAMASEMAMNRDAPKNDYVVQAQLRITAIDNANPANVTEYDDFLPMGLVVRVNSRPCNALPPCGPSTRQGAESRRIPRPINLSPLIKMSPIVPNYLVINWLPEPAEVNKTFIFTLNLVKKLTAGFLLDKLKERPRISIDITKRTILQQYRRVIDDDDGNTGNADDDDIATTIVRVSLVCPLAKCRIMFPAKGKDCNHLQCFDGSAYISLNEKKPMWNCTVCNRVLYYDDLVLDEYFMNVLQSDQLSTDCQEVQLLVDGTWKSYDEETSTDNNEQGGSSSTAQKSPSPNLQVPAVSGNGTAEDTDRKSSSILDLPSSDAANMNLGPVVDLTSDDESSPTAPPDSGTAENNEIPTAPASPRENTNDPDESIDAKDGSN